MSSLVTGADGFAGSHLVDYLLSQGLNVTAFVRSTPLQNLRPHARLKIAHGDLLDYNSLIQAFDVDYVYHLAAVSGVEECRSMPEMAWKVNTEGTMNVMRACEQMKVRRVLFASTCHTKGYDIYAASKRAGEDIVSTFSQLPVVITRAYNHYGERQRPEWLVPTIINQALKSDTINLGARWTTRDFTYVGDIVKGYHAAIMLGDLHKIYELGSGVETSIDSMVSEIVKILEWKGSINWANPRSNDFDRARANTTEAREKLGWEAKVTLEAGLRKTIAWYNRK